jgi:hypothetical protein
VDRNAPLRVVVSQVELIDTFRPATPSHHDPDFNKGASRLSPLGPPTSPTICHISRGSGERPGRSYSEVIQIALAGEEKLICGLIRR